MEERTINLTKNERDLYLIFTILFLILDISFCLYLAAGLDEQTYTSSCGYEELTCGFNGDEKIFFIGKIPNLTIIITPGAGAGGGSVYNYNPNVSSQFNFTFNKTNYFNSSYFVYDNMTYLGKINEIMIYTRDANNWLIDIEKIDISPIANLTIKLKELSRISVGKYRAKLVIENSSVNRAFIFVNIKQGDKEVNNLLLFNIQEKTITDSIKNTSVNIIKDIYYFLRDYFYYIISIILAGFMIWLLLKILKK